jgi:hypothetical protein
VALSLEARVETAATLTAEPARKWRRESKGELMGDLKRLQTQQRKSIPLSTYILERSDFSSVDLGDYPVLWLTRIHRLL